MQQTETYKLNLIETGDTFSPTPLNENMEKVEAVLETETAALSQRVMVLEAHRFYLGSYTGDGALKRSIELGFTPLAVLLSGINENATPYLFTRQDPILYANRIVVEIVENGFNIVQTMYCTANTSSKPYNYIAFT